MPTIAPRPLEGYVSAIFTAVGCEPAEASAIARRLVSANLVGHDSHGVVRVTDYVQRLKAGKIRANGHVTVITDTEVFAILDGASAFGQVIGAEAMAIGMSKARNAGVALIALRRTHHLGRIGDWAEECANQGFASIHFVNAVDFGAVVAPFNGRDRRVSTNPFCCGMPGQHGRHLILDFATSRIAEGKVIVARNKGMEVPEGCIIDAEGGPTRDPHALHPDGALLPFGEHKGGGLSFFCEILAGALSGGGCQHDGRPDTGQIHNNMLSIIIDPRHVGGASLVMEEVERYVAWMKSSRPLAQDGEVLAPGEPERRTREIRTRDGIPLDDETWRQLRDTARHAGISDILTDDLLAAGPDP
jgi:uncharacterized oxidoreductase